MIAPQTCTVGSTIEFHGYADDYGRKIVAVEFSLDDGDTWSRRDVAASDPDLAVMWTYAYTPQQPGDYRLLVRAVTEDGRVTPQCATVDFRAL